MEPELVIASSSTDAGVSCWDLHSGAEHLSYKTCSSPSHGLAVVAGRFLASSQLRQTRSSSGSIFYWSWNKPQVEVKSFPAEPITPLVSNADGSFIAGGGASGDIYLWQVASGRLLKKWHAHYRGVTCLVFIDDQSLLVSGAEDGSIRVWSLIMVFDDFLRQQAKRPFEHSFSEHTLKVTDIVVGCGGANAIIISASEDRTCKVWSLSRGVVLRDIVFPSIIDAIALDPGEHVFYAGGRDGKIYIGALNALAHSNSNFGPNIIGSLTEHSKGITCLAFSMDGSLLVSGSEDGTIRVWDTKNHNITRIFRHGKGPVNNILVVRPPSHLSARTSITSHPSSTKRPGLPMPLPLEKYTNSSDDNNDVKAFIAPQNIPNVHLEASYVSCQTMNNQIRELEQRGSSAATEIETERLKVEHKKSMQMLQQWQKTYRDLHQFCVSEILNGEQIGNADGQGM
nr:protein ROOT INITIATION DEFECTIVE 3 [Ipomoea trifida]